MRNKICVLFISFPLFFAAGLFAFADSSTDSSNDNDINGHVAEVYDQAVGLYDQGKFIEAKMQFEEINSVTPNYKDTAKYLDRIDRDAQKAQEEQDKKQAAQRQEQLQSLYSAAVNLFKAGNLPVALEKFNDIETLVPDFKSTKRYLARIKRMQEDQALRAKTDQAKKLYTAALDSYRAHQWADSKAKFESVEQIIPDFEHTRRYLHKIDTIMAKMVPSALTPVVQVPPAAPAPVVVQPPPVAPSPAPAPVVVQPPPVVPSAASAPAVSLADQQKQAQAIEALAERSSQLYHQLADIADDKLTAQTKNKMAQVDEILNKMKENKEHILRQIQEQQWKQQQQEARAREEERKAEIERMYQEALQAMHLHEYVKAKIQFMSLENISPDYRSTRHFLSHIDEDIKKAGVEAVTNYEKFQAEHLIELQDKENAEKIRQTRQEQEKEHNIDLQQQQSLEELTQKASNINDEIILLSQSQDYTAMKDKFNELQDTINALTALKDQMAKRQDRQAREKELAREAAREQQEMLNGQKVEQEEVNRQMHGLSVLLPPQEHRPVLSNQPSSLEYYKRREILEEQNSLFSEGVDEYEHHKYTEAKLLFGELADQHDRRAEAWLKKVDRAITFELLKGEEAEERERTAFIQDQLQAQRELEVIQEREHQRQKKLTEELERQQRLYQDDRLLQLRKEELLKAQVRERERQEAKHLRQEEENAKKAEMLRFHRIKTISAQPPVKSQVQVNPKPAVVVLPPVPVKSAAVALPAISSQQKVQMEMAERKTYLDKKEQEEKEREAKREAAREAREERINAVRAAREKRIEAAREAREKRIEEREKARERRKEFREQEERHWQELRQQQQEQREEKIRQRQMIREEAQHRQEMEREEQQRQAQLEAQREDVRKQLEDGVEGMYQDALTLYNQGDYSEAAERFKDVQDIIPGYKRSAQYMDEAHQKAMAAANTSAPPAVGAASVSDQDDVKALDIFDPNAK